ncbi:MAG: hypothetical protein RR740_00220 [Pseudomonas sp.]
MMRITVVLLIAAIGLGSAWQLERSRSRVKLQDQTIAHLQEQAKITKDSLDQEREWAKGREDVIKALTAIGVDVKLMQDQIKAQDLATRKALKELIANDKTVRDYMAMPVPGSLGVLYERKGTTDPTQYGSSGSLRPNSVPVPTASGTSKQ